MASDVMNTNQVKQMTERELTAVEKDYIKKCKDSGETVESIIDRIFEEYAYAVKAYLELLETGDEDELWLKRVKDQMLILIKE